MLVTKKGRTYRIQSGCTKKRLGRLLRLIKMRASLIAQLVKSHPTMQEISVQFLGQEDPLEKG